MQTKYLNIPLAVFAGLKFAGCTGSKKTAGAPATLSMKEAFKNDFFTGTAMDADKISRVTCWGVNDGRSWLNNWPIHGRTNIHCYSTGNSNQSLLFTKLLKQKILQKNRLNFHKRAGHMALV